VLVIDDEALVAAYVTDTLVGLGYEVVAKHDGAAAIAYYQTHWESVDLIILDMNMPVMSGPQTFVEIRKINPNAQVFIISGHTEEDEVEELVRQGALGFLAKPFHPATLAHHVAKFVINNAADSKP
jgi:CheY-like chemotaxis protein